jgi:hypothetical protein
MRQKTLRHLRNTRELRAETLDLAARLASEGSTGQLIVLDPVINESSIREEWDRLLPALSEDVRRRMTLIVEQEASPPADQTFGATSREWIDLDRPNYRFEVIRLLLGARLEQDGPQPEPGIAAHIQGTQVGLVESLGASQTPVRSALVALRDAGLIPSLTWLEIEPSALSMELLNRLGASPQTLRFRFERGAKVRSPAELVQRAQYLLGHNGPKTWQAFSLSGTPVAQQDVPRLDLVGTPRLDLVANIPRQDKRFDAGLMRLLDDGLELEPSVLVPAPVVVTFIRAGTRFDRQTRQGDVRCAHPCDIFFSLLDAGLRHQALQYAKEIHP